MRLFHNFILSGIALKKPFKQLDIIFILFISMTMFHCEATSTPSSAKYVASSPPCLAAKCKNGIALLVIHVPEMPIVENIDPIRIEQLDHNAMLCNSGWRVDGSVLAEKGRELCSDDSAMYGRPDVYEKDYGRRLGWGLVDYLVDCHVKDSLRSLSTAALLATNARDDDLYLVDTTGLYPCRALAIGSHSHQINEYLSKVDFMKLTVKDGAEKLLKIVRDCRQDKTVLTERERKNRKQEKDDGDAWHIPNCSIVEIVTMMKRDGIPDTENIVVRQKEVFLPSSV